MLAAATGSGSRSIARLSRSSQRAERRCGALDRSVDGTRADGPRQDGPQSVEQSRPFRRWTPRLSTAAASAAASIARRSSRSCWSIARDTLVARAGSSVEIGDSWSELDVDRSCTPTARVVSSLNVRPSGVSVRHGGLPRCTTPVGSVFGVLVSYVKPRPAAGRDSGIAAACRFRRHAHGARTAASCPQPGTRTIVGQVLERRCRRRCAGDRRNRGEADGVRRLHGRGHRSRAARGS